MGVYIVSSYDSTLSCIRINGSESWDKYRLLQDHSRLSSLSIWGLEHQFLAHHICRCHTYVPSRLTSSHGFNFDFDANWKKHSQNYNETAIQLSLNSRELDQTKKTENLKEKRPKFHSIIIIIMKMKKICMENSNAFHLVRAKWMQKSN